MLFFVVASTSACFLLQSFQILPLDYPMGDISAITNLQNWFQLTPFTVLVGLGGAAAITITGILTRSGTYALYAVLIFGIGAFLPILQYFVLAIPNTIYALVSTMGLGSEVSNPLMITVGLWAAVWGVMYMFGLVFQRDMT